MFALPLKDTPLIVLAVSNTVAVAALPVVSWLPAVFTPGKSIFPVPSNETPPIFLAVCNAVAVAAFPVALPALPLTLPVTLPVTFPSKFATSVPVETVKSPVLAPVNEPVPIRNLSALSSQPINALSESPLSRTIPISFAGVPVVPFPNSINLSAIVEFVVSKVVVVPFTSRLPVIVTLPVAATSANVTLLPVETACPIAISPLDTVTPVPPEICALTSDALGPVYVITPVPLSYASEPSPPASVTETFPLIVASVIERSIAPSPASSYDAVIFVCEPLVTN